MHALARFVQIRGPWLALGAGAIVCLVSWAAERRLVGEWGFPLDDTWIHCQIARNLTQGHGWSYNPGVAVQNSSGPLWTALVALGFSVFGPNIWVVKGLAVLCFLGCIAIAASLARQWSGGRTAGLLAGLLTATSVPLAWHGLSGMETVLAALLVSASIATFQRWQHGRKRWAWPVLAAFATATRPETLLLVPLLALEGWRLQRGAAGSAARRAALPDALLAVVVAGAVLLPYFALNLHLSGSLFPTTFGAKAGPTGIVAALKTGDLEEMFLSFTLYPYAWWVHALSFFGRLNIGVLFATTFGVWAVAREPRRFFVPGVLLLALPVLRGVAAPHVLPLIQEGRYVGCLMPVLYACAGVGIVSLWRDPVTALRMSPRMRVVALLCFALAAAAWVRLELRVPHHVWPGFLEVLPSLLRGGKIEPAITRTLQFERFGLFLALLLVLCLLISGWQKPRPRRAAVLLLLGVTLGIQAWRLPRLPRTYARHVYEIHAMDVELGRWVRQNVPPGTNVAVNDIGAIAWFGERPIVDAIGLATPELTPYWSPMRLRTLVAMRRFAPKFCIIFPHWFPEWTSRPSLLQPVLQNAVRDITILGGAVSIVYRMDWERFSRYYDDALLERLDPPQAHESFTRHVWRGMRNLGMVTRGRLYASAGDYLVEHGDPAGAERHYLRSTTLEPHEMAGWRGLLQLYHTRQRQEELGRAVQEMVRQLPDSPGPLEALAQWQDATGQREEACSTYERALSLHPDNMRLLSKLEQSLQALGKETEASVYRTRRRELESPPPPLLRPIRPTARDGDTRR